MTADAPVPEPKIGKGYCITHGPFFAEMSPLLGGCPVCAVERQMNVRLIPDPESTEPADPAGPVPAETARDERSAEDVWLTRAEIVSGRAETWWPTTASECKEVAAAFSQLADLRAALAAAESEKQDDISRRRAENVEMDKALQAAESVQGSLRAEVEDLRSQLTRSEEQRDAWRRTSEQMEHERDEHNIQAADEIERLEQTVTALRAHYCERCGCCEYTHDTQMHPFTAPRETPGPSDPGAKE